jgi:hypothetical protein
LKPTIAAISLPA